MGQARKRGTREDRIQQALERKAAERDARRVIEEATRRQYQAWFDGLTPEEQEAERRKHRKMSQAQLLMILAAAAGGRFL